MSNSNQDMALVPKRPAIPEPVKREIRQRCGFGCVICGLPLYEYDHLVGWADTREHNAEEITLLCDRHHKEKTNGLLPLDTVKNANAKPYNLQSGLSQPYPFHYGGSSCSVELGGNIFTTQLSEKTQLVPISVDNIPLLQFIVESGLLFLTVQIFDEFNNLILKIWDNELQYAPTPWDIEFVGKRLVIREASRKVLVDIEFMPPNRLVISRARLLCNGVQILIKPDEIRIPATPSTIVLHGNVKANTGGGVVIGPHPVPIGSLLRIEKCSRYSRATEEEKNWVEQVYTPKEITVAYQTASTVEE